MTCTATMASVILPGHVHSCSGAHLTGDHKCSDTDCRRWFYPKDV